MIIYAFVDGLIHEEKDRKAIWTLISPSAIIQGGNPYFVPDFDEKIEVHLALAMKVGKLGKGIAPRFAYRYVESVAPAALFVASGLLSELRSCGLPWASALSYDRSLALGTFVKVSDDELKKISYGLELHDEVRNPSLSSDSGSLDIEETIARISRDNTLKTGDLIIVGITPEGTEVYPGIKASFILNGGDAGRFNIR